MMSTRPDTDFLLTNFTKEVAEVAHAIVVSADGLLLACSADLPRERANQLAAVTAGLTSLTHGAATLMDAGAVQQNVVEMDAGFLFLMSIGHSGSLATLAGRNADVGHLGYTMARLVEQVGNQLTPAPRTAPAAT